MLGKRWGKQRADFTDGYNCLNRGYREDGAFWCAWALLRGTIRRGKGCRFECGNFSLEAVVGWPWLVASYPPAALSLLLLNGTGKKTRMKKLLSWDKDREIAYQLLSQAKQAGLGEDGKVGVTEVYCQFKICFVRSRKRNTLSPLFLPEAQLNSFTPDLCPSLQQHRGMENRGFDHMFIIIPLCFPPHTFPLLQHGSCHRLNSFRVNLV